MKAEVGAGVEDDEEAMEKVEGRIEKEGRWPTMALIP